MIYTEDFSAAVVKGIASDLRDAFRALIAYPSEADVEAREPRDLARMLEWACEKLASDEATMPSGSCDALDLPAGSTYAEGVQAARVQSVRLQRRFADVLDRRAGRSGVAAGRAA